MPEIQPPNGMQIGPRAEPSPNHFGVRVQACMNELADKTLDEIGEVAADDNLPAYKRFAAFKIMQDFATLSRGVPT